ncbi:MAG: sulfotransferase family protein [Pseudomonadota bacterium]
MHHKILVLWATPRSTSTAFEWMMRMRGDMTCFHEPFGEAWYFGEDSLTKNRGDAVPRKEGLSFTSVWEELLSAAGRGPVFSKDFPHYIKHLWNDAFLSRFQHSFLIRDPAKVVTSMYKNWPDFQLDEVAFVEQRELFDRLWEKSGSAPPVIDSDDLLEDPYGIVAAYCEAVGLPFMPEALRWEPGARDEVSWYDGGSWHNNLRNSDGLKPQPRVNVTLNDVPDRVLKIYETVLPHYRRLHKARLKPLAVTEP